MVEILIAIVIIFIVAGAICGLIQYAPFIPQPLKSWAIYAVGAVALVLIIIQLLGLLKAAAG